MVQLNTSNTPHQCQPIFPYTKDGKFTGTFRIHPDWLYEHDELSQGFKNFYGQVQRLIALEKKGFLDIDAKNLAKAVNVHPNTLSNYNRKAVELGLMLVIRTGRKNRYILLHHPWMGISEDQAKALVPEFSTKTWNQIKQYVKSDSQNKVIVPPQPTENKIDSDTLETVIREDNKEIRSMHASEAASISTITDTKIDQEKEPITNPITSTTTSTSNNDLDKNSIETTKSIYTLEIILEFVLAYALTKLGTSDEIRDHLAIARRFLKTGEKDPWIAAFIENGYVLSPINPLKDEKDEKDQLVEQPLEQPKQNQPNNQAKKISPSQARSVKQQGQTIETQEVKGKYPYQVYLDFANYELKQGKSIYSVKGLADWLYKNGLQDVQVGEFIELMRNTYAGGEMPCTASKASETEINVNKEKTENKELLDLLELGKQRFEQLEDYEQAELQEMKLAGADFFFTCSMNVQNALLGAIREEIYLELAKDLTVNVTI
jgi:hypothetical protein